MDERPIDEIELAERLFGPEVAEELRKRRDSAKPASVEVDPETGRRIYSHADD